MPWVIMIALWSDIRGAWSNLSSEFVADKALENWKFESSK